MSNAKPQISDTKPITAEGLERLDALEKAATPGPWHVTTQVFAEIKDPQTKVILRYPSTKEHNEALIVALRNAYPAIRARIAELEDLLDLSKVHVDNYAATIAQQAGRIAELERELGWLHTENAKMTEEIAGLRGEP